MASRLEKARQNPDSMKGKILAAARRVFGQYGYWGTTTRMIAAEVGIDISTMYYHWGEKKDLYEGVIADLNEEIHGKLMEVESIVHGKSIQKRLETAIDMMCDYLFHHPDAANLILFRYFDKTRQEVSLDIRVTEYVSNIAIAMGLALDKENVSAQAKARVLAVWNAVLNFISGEDLCRPILDIDREEYIRVVKETLKFILVPAFSERMTRINETE